MGSETHYARAFNWRGQELSRKAFHFSNELSGYLAFAKWLDAYGQSMETEKVMVGCEPTGHYWFNFARYAKLKELDRWNTHRQQVAEKYLAGIRHGAVTLPEVGPERGHVWHIFPVRTAERDRFQAYLLERGIETLIHYDGFKNRQVQEV